MPVITQSRKITITPPQMISKGQGIQARFDPDIVEAKRELAKRAQKKGKRREQAAALSAGKGAAGKRGGKGASSARKAGAKKQAPARPKGGQAKRKPAKSGDFRPGRARRAEVQQQRTRKRGSR